ncbi:MAG: hypothetical protein ACSLFM_11270 [Tepidiformaceae bacterium]
MVTRSSLFRLALVVSALTTVPLLVAGCGNDDDDGARELSATLDSYSIELGDTTIPAGVVEIEAENVAGEVHELVVIRTDLAEDALPVESNKVVEDGLDIIGEIEEFDGGDTESKTFTLAPGRYVLICNIVAHYDLGMHTTLTVE